MPARTPEECDRLFGEYLNAGALVSVSTLIDDVPFTLSDGFPVSVSGTL
jgi:hypothetical protein